MEEYINKKFEEQIIEGLVKILKSEKEDVDKVASNVYKTVYKFEQQSIDKGRLEEKLNIAKALLDVLDDKTISEKTKLDIEVVSKLRLEKEGK